MTEIEDAEGNRIVYTLDNIGNRTRVEVFDASNALARTGTRVFNDLNRLWKEVGAANTTGVTTTYTYDDNGNATNISAPEGRSVVQVYDELQRLTRVTDPLLGQTVYNYDALDQLVSVTDPAGLTTSYTINGLGDLLLEVSPDRGNTAFTYDSAGNVLSRTDARGMSVGRGVNTYDALNRLAQIQYPDHTVTYGYDTCMTRARDDTYRVIPLGWPEV